MTDGISNGSENEEVADQFSVWITRGQGTQTIRHRLNWTLRPGGGGGLPYETDGDARRLA